MYEPFKNLLVTWCTNQFNIQQLYALPTLYLFVLYLSVNKQWPLPHITYTDWFFITEMKCSLRGTDWVFKYSSLRFVFKGLIAVKGVGLDVNT